MYHRTRRVWQRDPRLTVPSALAACASLLVAASSVGAQTSAASSAPAQGFSIEAAPHGLQADFLSGPVQRYYVEGEDFPSTAALALVETPYLTTAACRRVYPKPERTRAAIRSDRALAAFAGSTQYGGELATALSRMVLYTSLGTASMGGINQYNGLAGFGGRMAQRRRLLQAGDQPQRTAAQPATGQQPPIQNRGAGFLSEVQLPSGTASRSATTQPPARRLADAQRSMPRDFTAFVSLSEDGAHPTLYIVGSMPHEANSAVPVNFSVEGRLYGASTRDDGPYARPDADTLIDKQTLTPATESGSAVRYFCFAYPLLAPPAGTQEDLLVRYWVDPSAAVTHGVALARSDSSAGSTAADKWIAIPITRLQRFQRDFQYQAMLDSVVGEPPLLPVRRKK